MACQQGLHVRHVLYHFYGRWLSALQSVLIVLYCRILEGPVPCSLQLSCKCRLGALDSTEQHNVSRTAQSAGSSCCDLAHVTARLLVLLQHMTLCLQSKHQLHQASGPTRSLACHSPPLGRRCHSDTGRARFQHVLGEPHDGFRGQEWGLGKLWMRGNTESQRCGKAPAQRWAW